VETSAKDGTGIEDAFILLVRLMMRNDEENVFDNASEESSANSSDEYSMPPSIRSVTSTLTTPSGSFGAASTLRSRGTLGESDETTEQHNPSERTSRSASRQ
jgi:hypothetical protein